MNTTETIDMLGSLADQLKFRIERYRSAKTQASKKHLSHEMKVKTAEIKSILQGECVVNECDLAGSGFRLIAEPDPAGDHRDFRDIDTPTYMRTGKPVELKTFGVRDR